METIETTHKLRRSSLHFDRRGGGLCRPEQPTARNVNEEILGTEEVSPKDGFPDISQDKHMHYTQAGERERDLLFPISPDRGSVGGEESCRGSPPLLCSSGGEDGDVCTAVDQEGASLPKTENGESALAGRCRGERRDGWCSAGSD